MLSYGCAHVYAMHTAVLVDEVQNLLAFFSWDFQTISNSNYNVIYLTSMLFDKQSPSKAKRRHTSAMATSWQHYCCHATKHAVIICILIIATPTYTYIICTCMYTGTSHNSTLQHSHIHMYIYVHVRACTYGLRCIHVHVHVRTCACTRMYTYMYMYVCIRVHVHARTCTCTCTRCVTYKPMPLLEFHMISGR